MKYHKFSGKMTTDSVFQLIEKLDKNIDTTIYFDSCGGNVHTAYMLYDFLKDYKGELIIKLTSQIHSTAFTLMCLLKLNNTKIEVLDVDGLIHLCTMNSNISFGDVESFNSIKYNEKTISETNNKIIKLYKDIGIKDSDIEKIKSGFDVCFTESEMKQLFHE